MIDLTEGVPFLQAVHYNKGRNGRKIDCIILHWMNTNLAGADATFTGGARIASATYGIENKTIHQYVREADGSYNCDDWDANMRSIALEHSAAVGRDASVETIETSIQVMVFKCQQYSISPDRIFPHNKFVATQCPGTLPWQAMREEVRKRLINPNQGNEMSQAEVDAIIAQVKLNQYILEQQVRPYVINTNASVIALTAAVAALASHPDITPEQMTEIINNAITEQVKVTGTLTIDPK